MKRITYITRSLASHALRASRRLLTGAAVASFATLALASCTKNEASTPGAFDPNATLSLSTATVEGLVTRAAAAAADRIVVEGFVDGDVIQIEYNFAGYTISDDYDVAYAKLSGGNWTLYSDIELTEVAKLHPNPDLPEESWENLRLEFDFNTRGIVTGADGKKEYAMGAVTDPVTNITTYYDALGADSRSTSPGTLKAGEYSVGTDGQISVCFGHYHALLSLPESALTVDGYTEAYDGISTLTGTIEQSSSEATTKEKIAFTFKPGAEPGKGTWQAVAMVFDVTAEESLIVSLQSLTATLAKDGTDDTPADEITVPIATFAADGKPVELQRGTRYPLTLKLTPTRSVAAIKGGIGGWGTEEGLETGAIEGVDYKLAKAGDRTSDWTIFTARGLAGFRDYVNSFSDDISTDIADPNATLANDIDLKGSEENQWTPIGSGYGFMYQGNFDGAGYTVSGLYIDETQSGLPNNETMHGGLFGYLSDATVKNLTVKGSVAITATDGESELTVDAGGIAGEAIRCTLTDCHSEVEVSATGNSKTTIVVYSGGIVGTITNSSLIDCSSSGAVTATVSEENGTESVIAGGICGAADRTSLTGCSHTTGTVSATTPNGSAYAGGIVGSVKSIGLFQFLGCTNTAEVKGSSIGSRGGLHIGGVVGYNSGVDVVACSNSGAITYNTGEVLNAGGLVGNSYATVVSSFTTTIPTVSAGGSAGSHPKIGGVIGSVANIPDITPFAQYPIKTCFYVGSADVGNNGIGNGIGNGLLTNNDDGGRALNINDLNFNKVHDMNNSINRYNDTPAGTANPCLYHWIAGIGNNMPPKLGK